MSRTGETLPLAAALFSNRQVTAMVIGLMAMVVLLPTTVWAVNVFTNVAQSTVTRPG